MRYKLLITLLPFISCQAQETVPDMRIAVISDLHVNTSTYTCEIFDAAMQRLTDQKPDLLLISGDLTDLGDKESHQYVAEALAAIESNGTAVYVIPGNHDIYGQAITRDDFALQYASFGYEEAVMKDEGSLSYLAYPSQHLALICLDSTRPYDAETGRHSDGGLDETTLAWAEDAARKARTEGHMVLAMMHHQLMNHFDHESEIAKNYVANGDAAIYPALDIVHQRLTAAGIKVMFTGHFHIQSCQHVTTESGELYDVSTGSLGYYASPIRMATLTPEGGLTISSDTLSLHREEQLAHSEQIVASVFARGAAALYPRMDDIKSKIPAGFLNMIRIPESQEEMLADMKEYMLPAMKDVYQALTIGDEDQQDPEALYNAALDALRTYILYICKGNQMLATVLTESIGNGEDDEENYLALFDTVLKSIVYNYVGTPDNVVPDNTISIQLDVPPASLEAVNDDQRQSRLYQLDGKPVADKNTDLYVNNNRITFSINN